MPRMKLLLAITLALAALGGTAGATPTRRLTMHQARHAITRHYSSQATITTCKRLSASRVRCTLDEGVGDFGDSGLGNGTYQWTAVASRRQTGRVHVTDDSVIAGL